ncbi:RNA exonuclease ngl2 [Tilletia horrida]|uniref:RNA exonuclease ngl2 n=1 Tax=Tilletia horrida TaxID=155126 RepID=A0AAN6GBE0_9BASI|nr:RNA exonuclease ngl2 [Tilletia horrida]
MSTSAPSDNPNSNPNSNAQAKPNLKPPKQPKAPKAPPSAEQIAALRAARALKRAQEEERTRAELAARRAGAVEACGRGAVRCDQDGRALYVGREWAAVHGSGSGSGSGSGAHEGRAGRKVRVVSWNILAQGLIQRKLFPGSDALKWRDRQPGLSAELVGHAYDVGCFQEVDRFDVHAETLRYHGFAYEYQRGYRAKKHGLAIVWRTIPRPDIPNAAVFDPEPAGRALLYLDHASVSSGDRSAEDGQRERQRRTACSRETRNIALFVAIRFASLPSSSESKEERRSAGAGGGGLIVATTHTFWHPRHGYERARQVGVLIRELDRFRRRPGAEWTDWDCVLAGDFNDQPDSATYELATARTQLRAVAINEVAESMVVHSSVDEKLNAKVGAREERPSGLVDITAPVGAIDGFGVELGGAAVGGGGKKKAEAAEQNGNAPTAGEDGKLNTPKHGAEAEEEDEDEGENDGEEEEEEEGEGEAAHQEEHEDRILKNCRLALPSDGLLTLDELRQLYDLSRPPPSAEGAYDPAQTPDPRAAFSNAAPLTNQIGLRSAYGSYYHRLEDKDGKLDGDGLEAGNFFGSPTRGRERWNDPDWTTSEHVGDGFEPMWTIFSALFSLTLDYVFLFPRLGSDGPGGAAEATGGSAARYPEVTALLRTHRTDVLQPGTPRKYVNASDHVAIGAEIVVKDG